MVAFTEVDQVSKAGWLELAEARKSNGSRSVSRLQLPSTEGEREVAFNEQEQSFTFQPVLLLEVGFWKLFCCGRLSHCGKLFRCRG